MPAGRPPFFETPEQLENKIKDFFDSGEHITITGLAYHLGFESRQSFYDYEKHDEFSYIIKRTRLRVEMNYEMNLVYAKNPTGSIFALKNMGWSDKQEIEQKTEHSGGIDIRWENPPEKTST